MNPLISIIVPVYNVENYLEETVKSLCEQSYENLEIILVNDGSTDNSGILCNQLALIDNRIRVIHKNNGGLSSARNTGINESLGDYIGFVDSDDYISSDMYEKLLEAFNAKDIGITSGQILKLANGIISPYNLQWDHNTYNKISPKNFAENMLLTKSNFSCCTKLFRRDLLENIRFREGRNNEDSYFMFDISKEIEKKQLYTVEIPFYIYYYRVRENSICNSINAPLEIDVIKNFYEFKEYYSLNNYNLSNKINYYIGFRIYQFCHKLYTNDMLKKQYFTYYIQLLKKEHLNNIIKNNNLKTLGKIRFILMCYFPKLYGYIYKSIHKRTK